MIVQWTITKGVHFPIRKANPVESVEFVLTASIVNHDFD